jgi:hypothetical protein
MSEHRTDRGGGDGADRDPLGRAPRQPEQAGIARGLRALAEVSRELPPPLVPGDRHDDGPEEAQSPHRHTYRGRPETPVVS